MWNFQTAPSCHIWDKNYFKHNKVCNTFMPFFVGKIIDAFRWSKISPFTFVFVRMARMCTYAWFCLQHTHTHIPLSGSPPPHLDNVSEIHLCYCGYQSFILSYHWAVLHWYEYIQFVYSLADGHVRCFQFLALINNIAVNTDVQAYYEYFISIE